MALRNRSSRDALSNTPICPCPFVFPQGIQRCNKIIVLCPSSVRFRCLSGWVKCLYLISMFHVHVGFIALSAMDIALKQWIKDYLTFFYNRYFWHFLKKNPFTLIYPSALKKEKKLVFNIDGNFREIFLRSWHLWFKIPTSKLFLKVRKHSSTRNEFTITWGGVIQKLYVQRCVEVSLLHFFFLFLF